MNPIDLNPAHIKILEYIKKYPFDVIGEDQYIDDDVSCYDLEVNGLIISIEIGKGFLQNELFYRISLKGLWYLWLLSRKS